jgi:uncharacterized protein with beta-barrel porin domain
MSATKTRNRSGFAVRRAVRLRMLLATTSLVGAASVLSLCDHQPAQAKPVCQIADIGNSLGTGPITNASAINCIEIVGSSVNGNVTNTSTGTINAGTNPASKTGILINTNSTINGAVINNGTITTAIGDGIHVTGALVTNGVTNGGTISVAGEGIVVGTAAAFFGGVNNSGTITSKETGVDICCGLSTFTGGFTNTGTITSKSGIGVDICCNLSTFTGGFTNTGTITSKETGVDICCNLSTFTGGFTNTGTITSKETGVDICCALTLFSGSFTNTGTITSKSGYGVYIGADLSTFSGNVVNTGTITGAGTHAGLYLNAVTFLGSISNTGTISGGVGISIIGTPSVSIFDSGTIIGTGGTAITFAGGPNTLTLGPGFNIQGNVLGSGSDTFQLGGTGNGAFNLSTIGTASTAQYQGFTQFYVVSGVWNTTGTFNQTQAWTVLGGTLAGTGTFQSVMVDSGGTLEPGTPGVPGTFMTIKGNLAFQSGSIYVINISPAAASRANVSGAVTLNGAAAQGILTPGSYSGSTVYDILDPTSINGRFSGFTDNLPGFSGTLTYNDNTDVLLNLTAVLGSGGGLNTNEQNVASSINNFFNSGGTLPAGFFPLFGLSGPALATALTQLDGEVATDAERGAFNQMDQFLELMLDPFVDGRSGAGWPSGGGSAAMGFAPEQQAAFPPEIALAYAGMLTKAPPPPPSFDQRWSTWAAGYGGSGTADGNAAVGSNNVTASDYGYAGGVDYHFSPNSVAGFALAGGGTNWNVAQGLGSGRSDTFQVGGYGATRWGAFYVAADAAFANHSMSTSRIAFASDQLTASFNAQSYGARLEAGYRYAWMPSVGVTPYAAVQVQNFSTPSYSETDASGGGFGLSYAAQNSTDTRSELGARFDTPLSVGSMPLVFQGRLAWAHDWVSNPALTAAFEALPGSSFIVNGAPMPQNSALVSAGAVLHITNAWSLAGKFYGEFADGSQIYAGTGTLRYSW